MNTSITIIWAANEHRSHGPIFVILNSRKLKLLQGHLFSDAVKIMLFISDTQYYVPLKLCRMAENTHLFKITEHELVKK